MRNHKISYSACAALTLDGKLGPHERVPFTRISSDEDIKQLSILRDQHDAVIYGGTTFRAWPKIHRGLRKTSLHHIIFSQNGDLPGIEMLVKDNPDIHFLIVGLKESQILKYTKLGIDIIPDSKDAPTCLVAMEKWMIHHQINNVLIEGGETIYTLFFEEKKIKNLHLTFTPKIMGETKGPKLCCGSIDLHNIKLSLQNSRILGDEIFTHYTVKYL